MKTNSLLAHPGLPAVQGRTGPPVVLISSMAGQPAGPAQLAGGSGWELGSAGGAGGEAASGGLQTPRAVLGSPHIGEVAGMVRMAGSRDVSVGCV